MNPVEFNEQNVVFAKDQKEYDPLPAFTDGESVISCWHASFRERLSILFKGVVWLRLFNFGRPLQPIIIYAAKPFVTETISPANLVKIKKTIKKDIKELLEMLFQEQNKERNENS